MVGSLSPQKKKARKKTAAFGRVGFSGSVSDLNSKRGKSTCLKRARDFVPAFRLHFSHWGAPSTCNPPSHPGQVEAVAQRISISCGLGHVQLAVAADACPLRTCNAISGGRGAEQDESAVHPLFPVALGPAYVWWLKEVGSPQGESSKGAQRRWGVS